MASNSLFDQLDLGADGVIAKGDNLVVRLAIPSHAVMVSNGHPSIPPNRVENLSLCKAFWLGPDRMLAISEHGRIDAEFFGKDALVSDITDGIALFHISGPCWREIFVRGSAENPDGGMLDTGLCAQTLFAGLDALVHCAGPEHLVIQIERPLASFFSLWLIEATKAAQASLAAK